jgi:hypothetical protein
MVLCEFCENITIAELATHGSGRVKRAEPVGMAHQPSWEALQESALVNLVLS